MSDLYRAYRDKTDDTLICGCCGWVIRRPKTLVENGTAQLVECPHCFKLNKVSK